MTHYDFEVFPDYTSIIDWLERTEDRCVVIAITQRWYDDEESFIVFFKRL